MTTGTFESNHPATAPAADRPAARRAVGLWLFAVSFLLLCMVVLGGVTRLTDSGLSITEWRPVTGVVPPLGEADWLAEMEKYRQIPEYQLINKGMSLEAFKRIYYYEWGHRLLGRLIGLVFFVPFVVFLARRLIPRPLAWRLGAIFVLGGLQGALGWYMVKSGLTVRTDVSQYRLTAHLGTAFLIQAAVLWTALGQFSPVKTAAQGGPLWKWALAAAVLVYGQVLLGGFVAGLDAGMIYNTWPLMGGGLVPGEIDFGAGWRTFFEDHALVQFNHRVGAYVVSAALVALCWAVWRSGTAGPRARLAAGLLLAGLGAQFALGVATLLLVVPVPLAAAHQAGAFVLFSLALWTAHSLKRGL